MQAALTQDRMLAFTPDVTPRLARNVALGLSIALHLACGALFLPAQTDSSPAPSAIDVELIAIDENAPQADAPADIPEEPTTAAAMPEAAPAPAQSQATAAEPAPESKTETPDAEAIAPRKPEKAEPAESAAPASAAAATDSETEAAARRAKARAYASAVSAELNRRRIYPAAARARGIVGAAKVGFTIDASGHVARFAILASSGHAILDESISKIMQAMHTPPPPEGAFEAVVTIRFGLR